MNKEEITGCEFLDLSQKELERWGMPVGPAKRLVKFANERKEIKKKAFSTYRIKDVLEKYNITNGVKSIPQFTPGKSLIFLYSS